MGGGANQNRRLIEGGCIWLQRLLTAKEQSQGGEWELCAFQQAHTHQAQKIPLHTLYKSTYGQAAVLIRNNILERLEKNLSENAKRLPFPSPSNKIEKQQE